VDDQVKIRGFRIEPGDVEHHAREHPRITEACVLARETTAGTLELVLYYVAGGQVETRELRDFLSERLPPYMIPGHFVSLERLPVNRSGKIDRSALTRLIVTSVRDYEAPVTLVEQTLTGVMATVLGTEQIGLNDSFFELGGDSIRAIQLVSRLGQHDLSLQVKDLFQAGNVRELAQRVEVGKPRVQGERITGVVPLTPIQEWFFRENEHDLHHFNQAVLLTCSVRLEEPRLRQVFDKLVEQHDMLRATFRQTSAGWCQQVQESATVSVDVVDLRQAPDPTGAMQAHASQTQASFDLSDGPLSKAVLYRLEDGDRLLIVIHHLLCDGVTWRILLEDLENGYRQASQSLPIELAERTVSYRQWAQGLRRFGESAQIQQDVDFWAAMDDVSPVEIPLDSDPTGVDNVYSQTETVEVSLSEEETHAFLSQPQRVYRAEADVVLLAALGKALQSWHNGDATSILLESHGREPIEDQDLARTVGWFTSMYPFVLRSGEADPRQAIRTMKEDLHRVPQHGISYGVARYLTSSPLDPPRHTPRLVFNYLGQFDDASGSDSGHTVFSFAQESSGQLFGARFKRQAYLEFTGIAAAGCLRLSVTYHPQLHRKATAMSLLKSFRQELVKLLNHCNTATSAEKTPADLIGCPLSLADYDGLLSASGWEPQDIDDMYPLAPMQAGLLYQRLLDPESSAYFIQMSFTLRGALDLRDFQAAWCDVVERHPILRTAFVEEGLPQPIQVVLRHRPPEFHDEDLSSLQATDQHRLVEQYTSRDLDRGFDLLRDPLLRFALFRLDRESCRLVWSYHHILLDGWSLGNLFQEFHTLYLARRQSREVHLPPVRPYGHYIEWLGRFDVAEAREFWRRHLHGVEQIASIPLLPGYGHEQGYEMGESTFQLTGEESTNLLGVAHRAKVTLSTLLQAAWAVVLSRYHDTHDIVFGSIVSGRPADVDRVEQIVGLFINAIPVRIQIDEAQTFVDLLGEVQRLALEAEPFHHCPLPEILTLTPLQQGLFDHLFIFENYPTDHATGMGDGDGDLVIEDPGAHDETHYPFNLVVVPGEQVEFRLSYNVHAYPEKQIEQVRDHLLGVLKHVAEQPVTPVSEIDILSPEENLRLDRLQGASPSPTASRTALDLFHGQVRAVPDKTALILGEKEITYNSLNRRANQLARYLRSQCTVASEHRVGVMLGRSENMVVAVLGVLKAGGAYLPIDAAEPADRAAFMLADAGVEVVLTDSGWADGLPPSSGIEVLCLDRLEQEIGSQDDRDLEQQPQVEDAAYVIYTSGSTGNPKGCVVEHRNLYSYLTWASGYYFQKDSDGHFGLFSPLSFDLTVTSLFLPLVRGNTLTVYPDGDDLREIFADMLGHRSRVDTLKLTPSHISLIREFGLSGDGIGLTIVGGEALLPDQVAFLHGLRSGLRVFNEYGPTETTVGCITTEIPTGATQIPIGRPILGTRIHILDERGRRVPIGVPGEIYIAGAGVSRGYLNNDSLTAERFLVGAFGTGERMYRSGDVGRWLPDGNVEYLGRSDDQVKIRGFRIEPGEVETCLLSHPRIAQVAVVATPAAELAAYVVGDVATQDLRQWLAARLPDHMVPSWFVAIDELPLTRNGKLDRGALPDPVQLGTQSSTENEAPRDELESQLHEIWVSVLQVEDLGIHDDFFRLGGHSLKATQIVSRILLTMDIRLGLREFFQHLTVADLAEHIRHAIRHDRVWRIQPAPHQETYGLSHAQKRLWLVDRLGDASSYNMPQAYLIHGDLDSRRMREALARIVQRHEILRTAFVEIDGAPRQQILNAIPLDLEQLDLTDRADPESDARDIVEQEAILSFDLAEPPLLRFKLLQVAQQKWVLLMNMHHIVGDGWSLNILFRELVQIFDSLRTSERRELAPLRIQYKDFSEWQNHQPFMAEEKYWLSRLAGNPTGIRLPFDFPPTDDRDFTGALETRQIDGEVLEGLRTLARSKQVTLANLLLALFKLFLFRLTKQEDLCVGVSVAGRNHPDLERLIGFFVNVLPIRSALSSDMDFDVLLSDISRSTLEAYDHQDYPFDLIIEKINPDRIANRQPLINVVFAFQNYADVHVEFESDGSTAAVESGGLRIEPFAFSFNTSKFDLTLFAFDDVDRLILNMEYDTGLFRPETIGSYLETLVRFAAMVGQATPAGGDE
jgi:iturin family lipopeptide synthetase B